MAGDWIKLEHATLGKPEVGRFAELLGVSHGDGVELLLRFWFWMDNNSSDKCPGVVRHTSAKALDKEMCCPGFCGALCAVEWLEVDAENVSIRVPNFERHNGNTAKTRASDAKRKSVKRLENVREMSGKNRTRVREENRREESLTTKTLMSGSQANADVLPIAKSTQRNQDATALLEFLNSKTGRHYRPTATTIKPILARLRDGFSVDECRAVIARKCRDWKGDDKMEPYLRPATLFGDQKFSQYVGEVPPETADAMP